MLTAISGLPIAITALQILAIDMIGEMLPLIALTWDPPQPGIMKRPPRDTKKHILDCHTITTLAITGLFMGALAYCAYL